jgi:gliding motility-associated-like protein
MRIILGIIGFIFSFEYLFPQQRDTVLPHIYVKLSVKPYDCSKGAAAIQIDSGKPPFTIVWSNGTQNIYYVNDLTEGDYSVKITDGNNKDTILTFRIEKVKCPVVPENHFSPNGDNYKDKWFIHNLEYYQDFELFVFNKWGQQVHHQKGGTYEPWDGRYLGVLVADATYYYILYLEKDKKDTIIKGNVTIIR